MVEIINNKIYMTRGDTLTANLGVFICSLDGEKYNVGSNDKLRFALKKTYEDEEPIIVKDIPTDTLKLRLESSETDQLEQPATYVYDIKIIIDDGSEEGYAQTIVKGILRTSPKVY